MKQKILWKKQWIIVLIPVMVFAFVFTFYFSVLFSFVFVSAILKCQIMKIRMRITKIIMKEEENLIIFMKNKVQTCIKNDLGIILLDTDSIIYQVEDHPQLVDLYLNYLPTYLIYQNYN